MQLYANLDLHSRNDYIDIKNGQGRKLNSTLADQQEEYLKAPKVNPKIFVNLKAG